jgi:hypothetical protein
MLSQAYLMNMEANKKIEKKLMNKMYSPHALNPNSPYKYTLNRRADILKRTNSKIPPRFPNNINKNNSRIKMINKNKIKTISDTSILTDNMLSQNKQLPKTSTTSTTPSTTLITPPALKSALKQAATSVQNKVEVGKSVVSNKEVKGEDLISVVMVTEEDVKYVYGAIHTILKQNHSNLELIIVDNNSQDGTVDYLKNLKDSRVKIYALGEKVSQANCYNLGINKTRGDWITFQGARYISTSDRLKNQLGKTLEKPNSISMVGGKLMSDMESVQGNYQSIMFSRKQLEEYGYFYDNDKFFLEYVKRLQKYGVNVETVNDVLYIQYDTLIDNTEKETLDEYPDDQIAPDKKIEFEP